MLLYAKTCLIGLTSDEKCSIFARYCTRCEFTSRTLSTAVYGTKKTQTIINLAAQMTAMISMSLVLIVLGLMSLGGIAAHSLTEQVRQRMGFTVIMDDNATADQINTLLRSWRTASYVSAVKYTSPAQALERWKTSTGDDEDIVTLLGTNPFRPEIDVNVTSHYANVDSLRPIIAAVAAMPGVGEVRLQARMIDNINKAVNKAAIVGDNRCRAPVYIHRADQQSRATEHICQALHHTYDEVSRSDTGVHTPTICICQCIQWAAFRIYSRSRHRESARIRLRHGAGTGVTDACRYGSLDIRGCDSTRRCALHHLCFHRHQPLPAYRLRQSP